MDEKQEREWNLVRSLLHYHSISMEYENVKMTPFQVYSRLQSHIEMMEREVSEQDRKLYEDIIITTLGDSIRRKIQYVKEWEKDINQYMEHEHLIKFRIKWTPKPGNDEELETNQLVELITKDGRFVDLSPLSRHFRSKIERAKGQREGEEYSLQNIMRDALDYRQWFEFQIFFTKQNDKEQKLTAKTYGKLSGGQKVMAMITPVLAAIHAKYSEAREGGLRVFSLDEAFSRVDDDNINSMFTYIQKLGLDYILNSQSLWGCFESVPSLDIYELLRPNNIPAVMVMRYHWNGVSREHIRKEITV
ncbi:SbcC/MukB-like Walker B domain-containing protein [Bacillus thuringiensis]|uniref:SbcC/MukB-like Walker B domain-containing protein n=1 Tax=Bacillus thuringiensis TaxID=1428 RepID=UPI0038017443